MENQPVNQIESAKPTTENKKHEWKRQTFTFHEGKAWCYKKMVQFEHREPGDLWAMGYYCYNCKNELFFRWKDEYRRDNEPFRFHKLLAKVLEKKDDDWKTERKTHTYYAFCCKCARKDEYDGTAKASKWTKKWLGFEIEKCDCADFIQVKKREATQSISNYESMIADCKWLKTQLEELKRIFNIPPKDFKEWRLNDFISQLDKRQEDAISSQKNEEDYLLNYNEWETKLNQQLDENE